MIKRRKLTPGTKTFPRAAGYTVLKVDEEAGLVLSVRSLDLQAYSNALKVSLEQAKDRLLGERAAA